MENLPSIDWSLWEPRFADFLRTHTIGTDAGHDLTHVQRVVANAKALAKAEGADPAVILPAAWLHDCVLVPKTSAQRSTASSLAARAAIEFLRSIHYPASYLDAIQHAIEAHSFAANISPRTLEAQVVQDADRLDALGAIGIARCCMLGAELGQSLYHQDEPIPYRRQADDARYVIDHFYRKLLLLVDSMRTLAGRAEAKRRTAFMGQFLDQLSDEIHGRWTARLPGPPP